MMKSLARFSPQLIELLEAGDSQSAGLVEFDIWHSLPAEEESATGVQR